MKVTQLIRGVLWRKIGFSDGSISFYDTRQQMTISSLFAFLLNLSPDFWREARYQYEIAKKSYAETFFKLLKKKGMGGDKLISLAVTFVDLGGWGKIRCTTSRINEGRAIYLLEDSAIASAYVKSFGKSKFPVCHTMRGALAGGAGVIYGKDRLDAVETKCLAKGDPYCEFLVKPRKEFLKTENKEYKKQLGLE